jgi:hypothetical protein
LTASRKDNGGVHRSTSLVFDRREDLAGAVSHRARLGTKGEGRSGPAPGETFMNDEFFTPLVLHEIQTAMDELAASA